MRQDRWSTAALRELTLARIRTMVREPEVLFWVFAFPILMAVGLGIAFRESPPEVAAVAVERGTVAAAYLPALEASPDVSAEVMERAAADDALRRGDAAMLLTGGDGLVYRYDANRPESRTARLLVDAAIQEAAGATRPVAVTEERVRQRGARYIDWVIPGLIGFNLMSTGLWAMGFYIVQSRQRRELKRLISTPMRRSDFLLSQILARLVFLLVEIAPLVLFAWLAFGVTVEGSLLSLAVIVLLGATCFACFGLLAASRTRTTEGVSGIINVIMLPMLVLSGVFFSSSRFPDAVQPLIQILPLTALNDALRAVYNDGLPLLAAAGELGIVATWTVLVFLLALWGFRWQ